MKRNIGRQIKAMTYEGKSVNQIQQKFSFLSLDEIIDYLEAEGVQPVWNVKQSKAINARKTIKEEYENRRILGKKIKDREVEKEMGTRGVKISEDTKREAAKLYDEGMTIREISERLNIGKTSVHRFIEQYKAVPVTIAEETEPAISSEDIDKLKILQSDFESLRKMVAEETDNINILLGAIGQLGAMKSEVYGIYVNSSNDETAQLYELIKAYERELTEAVIEMTKKEEPAPAATDTSSEEENNETLPEINDTIVTEECQVFVPQNRVSELADEMLDDVLYIKKRVREIAETNLSTTTAFELGSLHEVVTQMQTRIEGYMG